MNRGHPCGRCNQVNYVQFFACMTTGCLRNYWNSGGLHWRICRQSRKKILSSTKTISCSSYSFHCPYPSTTLLHPFPQLSMPVICQDVLLVPKKNLNFSFRNCNKTRHSYRNMISE